MGITREPIIEKWGGMTPRERDAWVAETVFGWRPLEDGRMLSADGYMIRTIPEYTTYISAAWSVVDISAEWGGMDIGCYGKSDSKYYVVSTYTDSAPYQRQVNVSKNTVSEAICLAAIIAKFSPSV